MVNNKIIKIVAGIMLLITVCSSGVFAQRNRIYPSLSKYRKLSIVAGPVLYNRANIYPQYGDYTFENKPICGFNAGFEYDFYPDRKWSFVTGFIVAWEPVYSIKYKIKEEDIYAHFTEDWVDKAKMYAMPSLSVPLLMRLNIRVNKKMFAHFITGLKVMYFPHGSGSLKIVFHNEDDTESREVFYLSADSPDNAYQGSFVIGTGVSFTMDKVLLKSNLIYVMNFQNTMDGYYMWDNLLTSPPAGGDYQLSGNFVGLLFIATIANKKIKNQAF